VQAGRLFGHLVSRCRPPDTQPIDDTVINRGEAVGLLFNVSDIAQALARIEILLGGDDGEEETDES
jgi:hypothetical protein